MPSCEYAYAGCCVYSSGYRSIRCVPGSPVATSWTDVAVAVEAAGVADVAVVVGDGDRVVELRPADALEVDVERLARLDDLRRPRRSSASRSTAPAP